MHHSVVKNMQLRTTISPERRDKLLQFLNLSHAIEVHAATKRSDFLSSKFSFAIEIYAPQEQRQSLNESIDILGLAANFRFSAQQIQLLSEAQPVGQQLFERKRRAWKPRKFN